MKTLLITLFLASVSYGNFSISQIDTNAVCPVIPTPVTYLTMKGSFDITENQLQINRTNLPKTIENYLSKQLNSVFSINTLFEDNQGDIIFKTIKNVPQNSYSIDIREQIIITYSSEESCFYAVNSLLQLIQKSDIGYSIQQGFIMDYPKFEWRGIHLDVSRHFYTVEEVKHFIDLIALYKFNTFHWHLTDDQGWRIEIKQFPKLTEIGAWRDSTLIGHYNDQPHKYDKKRVGGFYTQEQIKDIVLYAQNKYITIVPEIEMPGHSRAALAAYPEYSCTGIQQGVPGLWGVFEDIYCSQPETIEFLQKILDEVIPLFPSPYIHIGGDEAPKTRWHECSKCQKVIKDNGLKDEHELQSYFIRQMDAYLTKKGKKIIGWDEILEGGLSPNAAVMSWRGEEGGIEAAKQFHNVVMSPSGYCYFDHYQSGNPNEPLAIGGFLPLEKVYKFDPIPKGLTTIQEHYILGGQANLWTEYIPTMQKLEYMTFPRALAMTQALWCMDQKPDFDEFKDVLINYQLDFMDRSHINYSRAMFYPEIQIKKNSSGLTVSFKGANKGEQFRVISTIHESNPSNDTLIITESDSILHYRTDEFSGTFEYLVTPYQQGSNPVTSKFELQHHAAIGLPIEFKTPLNPKFSTRGNLALVDGVVGQRPWKGDQWLGFTTDTIEFIVDLTKTEKIATFKLGFLKANGSWIYLPQTVQLSVSKNKKKWISLNKQGVENESFSQTIGRKARYIKVQVIATDKIPMGAEGAGYDPWTFMDELQIELGN